MDGWRNGWGPFWSLRSTFCVPGMQCSPRSAAFSLPSSGSLWTDFSDVFYPRSQKNSHPNRKWRANPVEGFKNRDPHTPSQAASVDRERVNVSIQWSFIRRTEPLTVSLFTDAAWSAECFQHVCFYFRFRAVSWVCLPSLKEIVFFVEEAGVWIKSLTLRGRLMRKPLLQCTSGTLSISRNWARQYSKLKLRIGWVWRKVPTWKVSYPCSPVILPDPLSYSCTLSLFL